MKITIVGAGRAGSSFAPALAQRGHDVTLVHHDELYSLGSPDLILLTVPDDAVGDVASRIEPSTRWVVAHASGSLSLEVLSPHPRVGSLHPLMLLPSGELGAARLAGATYCVAGDDVLFDVARSLGGRIITLRDDQRTAYHATASVAANHLVALMGHVGDLAEAAGLSLEDFLPWLNRPWPTSSRWVRTRPSRVRRRAATWPPSTRTSPQYPSRSAPRT